MSTHAGWYPDPSGGGALRWWDGGKWTSYTTAVPTDARPGLSPGWYALSTWVQVGIGAVVLAYVALAAMMSRELAVLRGWVVDPASASASQGAELDHQILAMGIIVGMSYLASGVLFITWLYQGHRSSAMDAGQLRHGSGWAIGGWFVPILVLWRPCQMVQDVHRGATRRDSRLITWWWVAFLVASVLSRLSTVTGSAEDDTATLKQQVDAFASMVSGTWVAVAAQLVAGVLAITVVAQVRRAVRTAEATREEHAR